MCIFTRDSSHPHMSSPHVTSSLLLHLLVPLLLLLLTLGTFGRASLSDRVLLCVRAAARAYFRRAGSSGTAEGSLLLLAATRAGEHRLGASAPVGCQQAMDR